MTFTIFMQIFVLGLLGLVFFLLNQFSRHLLDMHIIHFYFVDSLKQTCDRSEPILCWS